MSQVVQTTLTVLCGLGGTSAWLRAHSGNMLALVLSPTATQLGCDIACTLPQCASTKCSALPNGTPTGRRARLCARPCVGAKDDFEPAQLAAFASPAAACDQTFWPVNGPNDSPSRKHRLPSIVVASITLAGERPKRPSRAPPQLGCVHTPWPVNGPNGPRVPHPSLFACTLRNVLERPPPPAN